MNQFFKFLFASCLGTALALLLLTFIGFSMISGLISKASESEKVVLKPNSILELNFESLIPEKTNNTVMDPFDVDQPDIVGLTDMVNMIEKAKEDPDIKGIYLNASTVMAGKATASVLREALINFKSSGKFVVSYANYYTQGAYYIASAADSVLLNPVGGVDFRGLSSMIAFYKGMLDKLDIQFKVFYAGKFKSATEPFRSDKMSEENRLQIREYLNGMYDIFVRDIAAGRKMPEAELRRIADEYEGRSAQTALKSRLIDRIAYEDQAFDLMKERIGLDKNEKLHRITLEEYYRVKGAKTDFSTKDKIAVVYAEGTLMDGENNEPGEIYDGKYVQMLRKIRKDNSIKAVVLRINSPGGSVLASENILREIHLIKEAGKPVVTSMGDYAASGGYYIACNSDSIFAEPNTLTGSIGVFGMVPILQKTMKENLGITYDTVRTGRFSAFGTPFYDFSPEESKIIQDRVEWVYEDFLQKVATGRNKTRDQIHEIAQGRVWPGLKAKEIGLVDAIGGLDRALNAAAKLAGLEKYRTAEYPRTKTGWEQIMDRFTKSKDRDSDVQGWIIRSELAEFYPTYKTLRDMRRTKGLQARLPYDLVIF
jgi:protease IV